MMLKIKASKKVNPSAQDPFEQFTLEHFDPPRPQGEEFESLPKIDPSGEVYPSEGTASRTSTFNKMRQDGSAFYAAQPRPQTSAKKTHPRKFKIVAGLLVPLLIAAAGAYVKRNYFNTAARAEIVNAYFDVRVIDVAGHPVNGAAVRFEGKRVGVTDSFGEWRRYVKVELGSTVVLHTTKRINGTSYGASRNFAVPILAPKEGELSLHGSIQLLRENDTNATESAAASQVKDNVTALIPSTSERQNVTAPIPVVDAIEEQSTKPGTETNSLSQQAAASSSVNTTVSTFTVAEHGFDAVWFDSASSETAFEKAQSDRVVAALRKRAHELGLIVEKTAPWHISIETLVLPNPSKPAGLGDKQSSDRNGLFLVASASADSSYSNFAQAKFLRNFENDPVQTAKGVLWMLSQHIQKSVSMAKLSEQDLRSQRANAMASGSSATAGVGVGNASPGWYATAPVSGSKLWNLSSKRVLANEIEQLFVVADVPLTFGGKHYYYVVPQEPSACGDKADCSLRFAGLQRAAPLAAWKRLQAKCTTQLSGSAEVFVSGYQARLGSGGIWEYWGQPGQAANLTVIDHGKVVTRSKIMSNGLAPAQFSLIGQIVSRRE